ncbi:HpcH/HpaI aldolase/citrate lyase family protein [Zavarzinia aquatilis]|nr:aldolase/citrate lyase family protein [Zavarzinia aquatilis]
MPRSLPLAPRNVFFCSVEKGESWAQVAGARIDAVIVDLEDEVVPDNKAAARDMVAGRIAALDPGIAVFVRSNSVRSPWFGADVPVIAALPRLDAIVVPKVECADDLLIAEAAIEAVTERPVPLIAVLESPPAFLHLDAIAAATPRLAGFTMGPFDLSRALGCARDDDAPPVVTARAMALMAARTHGLVVIDGPVARPLQGEERTAAFRRARAMGFDAKIVTTFDDADQVRAIFTPTEDETALARAIVAAFDGTADDLATLPGGATVDRRNLALARRILTKAAR